MIRTVALDSGAVVAIAREDAHAITILKAYLREKALVVVPAPVLAETLRGGVRDASVYRVLKHAKVAPLTERAARDAGARLGAASSKATVDAMIVAIAHRHLADVILTSDPDDIRSLSDSGMQIQRI